MPLKPSFEKFMKPKDSSQFPQPETWHKHRVSYGETDAMGVVYYANYLHWFEMARSTFLRERGLSYVQVEEKGIFLPVRKAECRYLAPARFDDLVFVRTGIEKWGRASIVFVYEVINELKTIVLATGKTEHACVNSKGRPIPIPEWLKQICNS